MKWKKIYMYAFQKIDYLNLISGSAFGIQLYNSISEATLPEECDGERALAGARPPHDADLLASLDVAVDIPE